MQLNLSQIPGAVLETITVQSLKVFFFYWDFFFDRQSFFFSFSQYYLRKSIFLCFEEYPGACFSKPPKLDIIVKDQPFRVSGLQFLRKVFGTLEKQASAHGFATCQLRVLILLQNAIYAKPSELKFLRPLSTFEAKLKLVAGFPRIYIYPQHLHFQGDSFRVFCYGKSQKQKELIHQVARKLALCNGM